jgi:hypothetical protein
MWAADTANDALLVRTFPRTDDAAACCPMDALPREHFVRGRENP